MYALGAVSYTHLTYDEFREENLNSGKAPMMFAHYTVDFYFHDQLLEIFTK